MSTPRAKTSGMSTSGRPSRCISASLSLMSSIIGWRQRTLGCSSSRTASGPRQRERAGAGRASRPRGPRAAEASRRRASPPSRSRSASARRSTISRGRATNASHGGGGSSAQISAMSARTTVGLGGADPLDLVARGCAAARCGIGAAKSGIEWRSGMLEVAAGRARRRAGAPRACCDPRRVLRARPLVVEREERREELPQRADRQPRAREVVVVHLDADHARGP